MGGAKTRGIPTLKKMETRLFLVVILLMVTFLVEILPIVASLESLRGREESGRDLTCR